MHVCKLDSQCSIIKMFCGLILGFLEYSFSEIVSFTLSSDILVRYSSYVRHARLRCSFRYELLIDHIDRMK